MEIVGWCAAAANVGSTLGVAMSGGAITLDFDRTVIVQAVLFLLLVVALKPLLFDPVLRVFEAREQRTEGAKDEARRLQEQAGELLQQYDRELELVQQMAAEERERLRAETSRLETQILSEAREATARIVEDGRRRIAADVDVLRKEIKVHTDELARSASERVLGRHA